MAILFSSVEKSNPRWNDLSPVDMSVRLAILKSNDGLARRDAALSEGVIF